MKALIEHKLWVPTEPTIDGHGIQRLGIVGYSHYYDDYDRESVTTETLEKVASGELNHSFFVNIQSYFRCENDAKFWRRVYFFNFLPDCIGRREDKFKLGTDEQINRGKDRVLRILESEPIDRLFVFTRKGWNAFPNTIEENAGQRCTPFQVGSVKADWGRYPGLRQEVRACGFRHPLYANQSDMRDAVRKFMFLDQ
jgi:hypothetical protein